MGRQALWAAGLALSALLWGCARFAGAPPERAPGAAWVVVRDGEIVERGNRGLADLERGVPISSETAFRLASVSKQFTAMAILLLAEEGRLAYDDPIARWLPELARFGRERTLRQLLTHTAGLPDYYDVMAQVAGVERPRTADALAVYARWGEPLFPAGERFDYSNPGYELLALVVERASGQSYAEFVESRIFAPLGMTGSRVFDERAPPIPNRAYGYRRQGEGFALDDDDPLNYVIGSGGIYASIDDLVRWDQALYEDDLVRQETLAEAFRPARLRNGEASPYGFGWAIDEQQGHRRVSHSGSWVGFRSYIARYPDDRFSVIVLSNLAETESGELADALARRHLVGDVVVSDAVVVDGTGAPPRRASVRIAGKWIAEVGDVTPSALDTVVDAGGASLAPGFIDTHSHADGDLAQHPDALAAVSQGITTVIVGQDGESPYPLDEFFGLLEQRGSAVDVASYTGFGTLRRRVLGDDYRRPATPEETERMQVLLRDELAAGSLGLSTGLEYEPDSYATTEEVVALAREAAAAGGRYISHIRSEDRRFWEALDELIQIGREAGLPVQISHLKLALRSDHGSTERLLALLDAARRAGVDVTADVYPYTYWESTLDVLFPDRNFESLAAARFALSEVTSPEGAYLGRYLPRPEYEGLTLLEVAKARDSDPAAALIDLVRAAHGWRRAMGEPDVESVIATSMQESDVERLLQWPHTNLCSDGSLAGAHPRGFGTYPRFLGRYVRERRVLDLASAVAKASGLAAAHVGLHDRGVIAPGMRAHLVLFDPQRVLDRATPEDPHALSSGILRVWVNGEVVFQDGQATGRLPGVPVPRPQATAR